LYDFAKIWHVGCKCFIQAMSDSKIEGGIVFSFSRRLRSQELRTSRGFARRQSGTRVAQKSVGKRPNAPKKKIQGPGAVSRSPSGQWQAHQVGRSQAARGLCWKALRNHAKLRAPKEFATGGHCAPCSVLSVIYAQILPAQARYRNGRPGHYHD